MRGDDKRKLAVDQGNDGEARQNGKRRFPDRLS
jgi:hypothetical protein